MFLLNKLSLLIVLAFHSHGIYVLCLHLPAYIPSGVRLLCLDKAPFPV